MLKKAGLMAAGIVVGLVITGVLMEQERRREEEASVCLCSPALPSLRRGSHFFSLSETGKRAAALP